MAQLDLYSMVVNDQIPEGGLAPEQSAELHETGQNQPKGIFRNTKLAISLAASLALASCSKSDVAPTPVTPSSGTETTTKSRLDIAKEEFSAQNNGLNPNPAFIIRITKKVILKMIHLIFTIGRNYW